MIPAERCLFLLPKDRRAKSKVLTKILFVIEVRGWDCYKYDTYSNSSRWNVLELFQLFGYIPSNFQE